MNPRLEPVLMAVVPWLATAVVALIDAKRL